MQQRWNVLKEKVSPRDLSLFLGFYYLSSLLFYTASWISYGAFEGGHPPYFDLAEYFSAAGFQFLFSLLLTLPVWYLVIIRYPRMRFRRAVSLHLLILPLFVALVYFLLALVKGFFGWAFAWGGYSTVWTLYIIGLFYLIQFGLIHAYVYHKRYLRDRQENARLREATLQSEIAALKAQLNPHFLHNLFNSINASIPPENERTRELIVQLSDLFRYQHAASQKEWVPIRDEIRFLENYLALHKVRLKERLLYQIEVDPALLDKEIPPMLLQPLVENALTHGIAPKLGPSELKVSIRQKGASLTVEIADTGQGIAPEQDIWHQGLGLTHTRQRLRQLLASELILEPNQPSGLKVSFTYETSPSH